MALTWTETECAGLLAALDQQRAKVVESRSAALAAMTELVVQIFAGIEDEIDILEARIQEVTK